MPRLRLSLILASALHAAAPAASAEPADYVLFDFESGTYDGWTLEGEAFGSKPFDVSAVARWRQDRQFRGARGRFMVIVGAARHESGPPGRMLSRPFSLDRAFLKFQFGAELRPDVRIELWVDGERVRRAYGNNSYDLIERGWNVQQYRGRRAQIMVVKATSDPALLRLDHFALSDVPPLPLDALRPQNDQEATIARPGEYRLLVSAPPGPTIGHSSLLKGHDGRWHLFGALQEGRYISGSTMLHAVADEIAGPYIVVAKDAFTADKLYNETKVREPFVLFHEGTYYLFYVGNGKDWTG